jgi:pimeloyl-ACP methyl ester carboxylesterase
VRHTDEQLDVEAVSVSLALDGDGLEVTGFEPEADAGRGSCVLEVVAARDDLDLGRLESGLASSPEFGSIAPSTLVTHGTAPARSPPREALTDRMPPLPLPRGQSASGEGAVRARRLRVLGWHRNQGSDVLLLIHGFNMSVEHGTQMLAQFLALSRLPPRIKPLVFSWSAATIPTYFCAVAAAKSAEIGRDLRACLQALDASGINDVHVLCHSMGAQVLCHHLERAVVRCGRLRLATVTFLNPEVAEAYFLRQLPRLRAVCPHITVFGDRDDRALFWSERVNGGVPQLGRLRGAPYRVVGAPAQGDASGVLDHDSSTVWADIDCIDCRWLSTNVHKLHHYSFNLNRSLMDDLREIICDRKRAVQRRARLVRRIGNVYSFLQPPPHVVND